MRSTVEMEWWRRGMDDPEKWKHEIFYFLSSAYGSLSVVVCIQLIRIHLRVREYGWTTQKVFNLMNLIVYGARSIVFGFYMQFLSRPKALRVVLLDLPGLVFFSTYTMLILFWAEIYHQAKCLPTDMLKNLYVSINCGIYLFQISTWIYIWVTEDIAVEAVGKMLTSGVSFVAAFGFLLYGRRLFHILKRFPAVSTGTGEKLQEIGSVTTICTTSFLVRSFMEGYAAFNPEASLDFLNHPIWNLVYYMLTEIFPSAMVLYMLRKMPPKRVSAQYHPHQS